MKLARKLLLPLLLCPLLIEWQHKAHLLRFACVPEQIASSQPADVPPALPQMWQSPESELCQTLVRQPLALLCPSSACTPPLSCATSRAARIQPQKATPSKYMQSVIARQMLP